MFLFSPHNLLFLFLFIGYLVAGRVTPFFARLKGLEQAIVNVQNMRLVFQPKQAHDVPYLDVERVEAMSRELEALGFQRVGDFACLPQAIRPVNPVQTPAPLASPFGESALKPNFIPKSLSFLRLFLSPGSGCAASVTVRMTLNRQTNEYQSREDFYFVSFSDSTHAGEEWRYETSNAKRSESLIVTQAFSRRNRVLTNYLPDVPLTQLWEIHQRRREQISHAGGFLWKGASLRDMEDSAIADLANTSQTWENMTPLQMTWRRWRFKQEKNPNEWLGELRGKVPPLSL